MSKKGQTVLSQAMSSDDYKLINLLVETRSDLEVNRIVSEDVDSGRIVVPSLLTMAVKKDDMELVETLLAR